MTKQLLGIKAKKGTTPALQLSDCLSRLRSMLKSSGINLKNILRQNIFIRTSDNEDYYKQKEELSFILRKFYSSFLPSTSFAGQAPENKKFVSLEVLYLSTPSCDKQIKHKKIDNLPYTVVSYPNHKEVYGAGLTSSKETTGIVSRSKKAFKLLGAVLKKENLSFSDIVRQWNYIEDITGFSLSNGSRKQNYQVFNDIRTLYYNRVDFPSGYPAATGIGTNTGGIIIDFTAASSSGSTRIIPISNPRQIDAHKYPQEVLIGIAHKGIKKKGSPKFERAKYFSSPESRQLYISGTAAIIGQKTVTEQNACKQTRTTLENITELISTDNLKAYGIIIKKETNPSYIRVYIKDEKDIPYIKEVCREYWGEIPSLFLVSDICREDLLVEIEGIIIL